MNHRALQMRVLRAQSGDAEAFEELIDALGPALFRCVRHIVGRRDSAEDVLQEVLVILHQRLPWLRDPRLIAPWAYRIATREAFRLLKREGLLPRAEDVEPPEAVLEDPPVARDDALVEALPALVAKLAPGSRAVLILHYFEELTLPEVADVLGIPLGTVKSRLAYGLSHLRRDLGVGDARDGASPDERKGATP